MPEKSKRTFPTIESIETLAKRTVSIETLLSDANLAKCHPQEQSPLFRLPAELRNTIIEYTCTPYDDPENKYDDTEYYYRPEHQARQLISYSILLTCRRAWLEANHLPMRYAVHTFWFRDSDRRPKYLDRINPKEGNRMDRMCFHIFVLSLCILTFNFRLHSYTNDQQSQGSETHPGARSNVPPRAVPSSQLSITLW